MQATASIGAAVDQLRIRLNQLETERLELVRPLVDLQSQLAVAETTIVGGASLNAEIEAERTATATQLASLDARISSLSASLTELEVNGELAALGTATIFQVASPPLEASTPLARNVLVGIFLGLALGGLAVVLVENLDTKIRTLDDVRLVAPDLIPLVEIPKAQRGEIHQLSALGVQDPSSPIANAYRRLRTALQLSLLSQNIDSVVVTSPNEGEGKSTTAFSLAASFADLGRTTLLIDADLRRPRLHTLLRRQLGPGLTDYLLARASLEDLESFPDSTNENFIAITAGSVPPNPTDLLSSTTFSELILRTHKLTDMVIVDAAPVLPVPDSLQIAAQTSGVILVVKAGATTASELRQACLLYTSPSPRDRQKSRMPSSA